MLRVIVLFGLITSAFAGESLDPLVNASVGFSMAIQQQLATTRSDPARAELAEKTIDYAGAKWLFQGLARRVPARVIARRTGWAAKLTERQRAIEEPRLPRVVHLGSLRGDARLQKSLQPPLDGI